MSDVIIDPDEDPTDSVSPIIPIQPKRSRAFSAASTSFKTIANRKTKEAKRKNTAGPLEIVNQPNLEDETSLFLMLMTNKSVENLIIKDWNELYGVDKENAVLQIVQLILNTSGRKGKISAEILKIDNCESLYEMPMNDVINGYKYPIINKEPKWKRFSSKYVNFIQSFVKSNQGIITYDDYFMDQLLPFLRVLSYSLDRAIRHTASLTAIKLMTSIIDVTLSIIAKTNCSLNNTCGSSNSDIAEHETELLKLKKSKNYLWTNICVIRLQDVSYNIRLLTISELCVWLKKFPSWFLNYDNLNHIGNLLLDKSLPVKLKSMEVLEMLYDHENSDENLSNFLVPLSTILVSLVQDKNHKIAIKAINLSKTIIFKNYILTPSYHESIFALVFFPHQIIGRAAGEFLHTSLMKMITDDTENDEKSFVKRYIVHILEFCYESGFLDHTSLVIDSLIKCSTFLQNWDCFIEILLGDTGSHTFIPDEQMTLLIDLMLYSISQTVTKKSPRDQNKSSFITLSKEEQYEARQNVTLSFLPKFYLLIKKFYNDQEALCKIITIPQFFNIDENILNRYESSLIEISNQLKSIFMSNKKENILSGCLKTLEIFLSTDTYFKKKCESVKNEIIVWTYNCCDEEMEHWKEYNANDVSSKNLSNNENWKSLSKCMMKLSILYQLFNLNHTNVMTLIYENLSMCLKESSFPLDALIYTIHCSFFYLAWGCAEIDKALSNKQNTIHLINDLSPLLKAYMCKYEIILNDGYSGYIQRKAFLCMCDVYILYSDAILVEFKNIPNIESLVIKPSEEICNTFDCFIQSYVFNDDDEVDEENKRSEILLKNHSLLAYCKLLIKNIVPVEQATTIIQHYNNWFTEYGVTITFVIHKIQNSCHLSCCLIFITCLKNLFSAIKQSYEYFNKDSSEFIKLIELAKRLASLLNVDKKNQANIILFHKMGILFALEDWQGFNDKTLITSMTDVSPPNLLFFEILVLFQNSINRFNKKKILKILDWKLKDDVKDLKGEKWHTLKYYRNLITN